MADKLKTYRLAQMEPPKTTRLWPLYGAGLENMGREGKTIEVALPAFGADELLVRHDACGLCFSDIKVIKLGQDHPRIYRNMREEPVVLGHEVCMTVIGVGENLKAQYHTGDRFIVQADIYWKGVNYAYGYEIQGGLSEYNVIGERILRGDHGCYLIPVRQETGYAESALTEPWACVIAAYELTYRTGLKAGGTTWIVGTEDAGERPYTIGAGFDRAGHPDRLMLSRVSATFAGWLRARAAELGIAVLEADDLEHPPVEQADDIILLGGDVELIEKLSPRLADHGLIAVVAEKPLARKASVDVGRVHYNRWAYVGGREPDIAKAFSAVPVRAELRAGGRAWFVGAGGPIGRMHAQRAIQAAHGPSTIVCTDVSDLRLEDLRVSFSAEAEAKGVALHCLNPSKPEDAARMAEFKKQGFDDIIVLAPVPPVISDAATYLAPKGVMNVFAGVNRGTMVDLDLSDAFLRDTRVIGHSASSIDDLRLMLSQAEAGTLSPNRSVAAIGSLDAAKDGMQAVLDTRFPGKVVIYPNITDLPLTGLPELKEKLPSVFALLKDGREWTNEAEAEFLRLMLK